MDTQITVITVSKICIFFSFILGVVSVFLLTKQSAKQNDRFIERTNQLTLHNLVPMGNATLFYEKCLAAINNSSLDNYVYVVLDLDDFKVINKMYGYDVGDKVLEYISNILKKSITDKEVVARIDSDIFNLLLLKEKDKDILHKRLEGIVREIQAFDYMGIKLKPSLGVYMVENADEDIICIGTNAYLARKSIKGYRTETIAYYDNSSTKEIITNHQLINEFAEAIRKKEFKVFYQGKQNLQQDKTVGAEALVRWYHNKNGVIPPLSFIELFECSGDIVELDLYVFDKVCSDMRSWVLKYGSVVKQFNVSINISRRTLLTNDIVDKLSAITKKYKISPKYIELELTETFFFEEVDKILSIIRQLKKKGFKISVDDFGSGYSSFNILKDMKIDVLKIDKCFLSNNRVTTKTKSILESIVSLSQELGVETTAEGVETKEQSAFLKKIGCKYAQGYYYFKPIPAEDFEQTVVKPFVMDIQANNTDKNSSTLN